MDFEVILWYCGVGRKCEMAKNRIIPFGYMMRNGVITANPNEVLAVVTIFSEYIAGKSLSEIASQMEVPYNDDLHWNKNMVKRILENKKYLGTEIYPQLISNEIFMAANEKRTAKATSICIISEELQEIRNITFCSECGHRLFRKGGNTRPERWDCLNKDCERFSFRLTDQMLTDSILCIINAVIANPILIDSDSEKNEYRANSEIILKQNEINRMMDDPHSDLDKIKEEIFRLAEMKYARCIYSDIPHKTKLLKAIIADTEQLDTLNIEFMQSLIKEIQVSHNYTVEAEFINGVKIRNTTVRGNENEHSSECNNNSSDTTNG